MNVDPGDSPWDDVRSQSEAHPEPQQVTGKAPSDSQSSETGPNLGNGSHASNAAAQSASANTASHKVIGGRRLAIRKIEAQPTSLEDAKGSFDPLGPLGGAETPSQLADPPSNLSTDNPSTPPGQLQQSPISQQRSEASIATRDLVQRHDSSDSTQARGFAQSGASGTPRQVRPDHPINPPAKPSFEISVGDPHKVGDLATSHIVYQVRTKTSSTAYRQPDFAVSRRYRDFLWLYNSLHNNNPGIVVPPPPEKQAVGRFDTSFVESRRQALERMLNKTASHPVLHHDADLKLFLESDSFNLDVKNKENKEPDLGQNKGMLSSLGINVGSNTSKFVEHDDWFHDRKIYLDALESQLKALLKTLDLVVTQRKLLSEMTGEFATSLGSLASVELSPSLSGPLIGLSDVQLRIRELYERQAQQDVLTLGITIEEYTRLISSIKQAFQQRQKAYHSWHSAENELQKRRGVHEKLLRQGRSQQDKLNEVGARVAEAERSAHSARLLFEDMGRLMRGELERFEKEKVEDFKSGVETFLEGAVEAQKELIELWETFLVQLDAQDDDLFGNTNPSSNAMDQSHNAPAEVNKNAEHNSRTSPTTTHVEQEA